MRFSPSVTSTSAPGSEGQAIEADGCLSSACIMFYLGSWAHAVGLISHQGLLKNPQTSNVKH